MQNEKETNEQHPAASMRSTRSICYGLVFVIKWTKCFRRKRNGLFWIEIGFFLVQCILIQRLRGLCSAGHGVQCLVHACALLLFPIAHRFTYGTNNSQNARVRTVLVDGRRKDISNLSKSHPYYNSLGSDLPMHFLLHGHNNSRRLLV